MKKLIGRCLIMDVQLQRRSSHKCLVTLGSNQLNEAMQTSSMLSILKMPLYAIYHPFRNKFRILHMFHRWKMWKVWKIIRRSPIRLILKML